MILKTQENKAARLHFKKNIRRTENRKLINEACCCQVMPRRKLHLSVLKGACRCKPWIENGAGKQKKKGRCGMFMLLIASPLPVLSLFTLFLTRSFALSYILIRTEEHTHLPFQTPSASLPSPLLFNLPRSFSFSSHKGQRDRQSVRLLIEVRMFRSLAAPVWITARMFHWPRKDHFTSFRESKWRKNRYSWETEKDYLWLCWFLF